MVCLTHVVQRTKKMKNKFLKRLYLNEISLQEGTLILNIQKFVIPTSKECSFFGSV